jgi:glycosyltransferase involved in cell wall biosynthesis
MEQGELVSVCLPVYNGEMFLKQCLDSILNQTYSQLEIIIVDDGSTDKTLEIVNSYKSEDSRVRVYQNQNNLGLVNNWNRCIELASGEWIKFIFQDDYVTLDMIERMMYFASIENKFIVCNREFTFEEEVADEIKNLYTIGRFDLGKIFSLDHPAFINKEKMNKMILKWRYRNYIGEPTVVLFHKSAINEIGLFNNQFGQICDLDYWLRLSSSYGVFYIPETLAWFRVHNKSTSSENRKQKRELVDYIIIHYEFLYGKNYESFRHSINAYQKFKLLQLLKRHIHMLKIHLDKNRDDKISSQYKSLTDKLPRLKKLHIIALSYYFLMPFLYIRRFISNKFKITIG